MSPVKLSIVVFAYNESENIPPVMTELISWLRANPVSSEIVFVDDGSTDTSLEIAKRSLAGIEHRCLRHKQRSGIGAALKTGVAAARGEWVSFLPADGQIPPEALGILMSSQYENKSNIVFSVYENRNDGVHRKILSWGVRTLIFLLLGVRLKSDGPYLFRRLLFNRKKLPSDSFFLNLNFLFACCAHKSLIQWSSSLAAPDWPVVLNQRTHDKR
ncbi:MAG: glycosyltransferase family 2 protein [Myxococcales bacterium]|nr:MAG: glycosyltransferase family 2 protein [Myxococcales bacterium]